MENNHVKVGDCITYGGKTRFARVVGFDKKFKGIRVWGHWKNSVEEANKYYRPHKFDYEKDVESNGGKLSFVFLKNVKKVTKSTIRLDRIRALILERVNDGN